MRGGWRRFRLHCSIARAGAAPTIVRVAWTGLLQRLKSARGRIVAVVPYATVIANPAAWKRAISVARSSKMLDLAVGTPKTRTGVSASNPFPGLKPVASVPRPQCLRRRRLLARSVNLRPQLGVANSIVLVWDAPAPRRGSLRMVRERRPGRHDLRHHGRCDRPHLRHPSSFRGRRRRRRRTALVARDAERHAAVPASGSHTTVDTTAPTVTVSSGPEPDDCDDGGDRVLRERALRVRVLSRHRRVRCLGSPAWYSGIAGGAHTFRVRATDAAGNVSAAVSYGWTVTAPATAPDTTITAQPSTPPTYSTSASFSFTSTQDGSTFECKLDAAAFAACLSPKAYTGLADGAYTFQARATAGGLTDATPASTTWTVISTIPQGTVVGNVFMSPSGNDSGTNCQRFATPVANPGGAVCRTLARAYSLASKGDTVVMAGGTYSSELRRVDAAAKGTAGGGCDRYAGDTAGCVSSSPTAVPPSVGRPGAEIHIELPYVHLKGLTIPSGPYGDIYAGVNDTSTNVKGIWLDSVDIPQFFATNMDGFAITDSRVGPCATSSGYSTCDSQIKGGYQAPDTPTLEHDILIDNVTFHDTWRTGGQDHLECLLVFDAKNITVRNSAFQNCGIIDFFLASTSGHPLSPGRWSSTVFDSPGSHSTTSPVESDEPQASCSFPARASICSNITVRNNSFIYGYADGHPEPPAVQIRRNDHVHRKRQRWPDRLPGLHGLLLQRTSTDPPAGAARSTPTPVSAAPNANPVDLRVSTFEPGPRPAATRTTNPPPTVTAARDRQLRPRERTSLARGALNPPRRVRPPASWSGARRLRSRTPGKLGGRRSKRPRSSELR